MLLPALVIGLLYGLLQPQMSQFQNDWLITGSITAGAAAILSSLALLMGFAGTPSAIFALGLTLFVLLPIGQIPIEANPHLFFVLLGSIHGLASVGRENLLENLGELSQLQHSFGRRQDTCNFFNFLRSADFYIMLIFAALLGFWGAPAIASEPDSPTRVITLMTIISLFAAGRLP